MSRKKMDEERIEADFGRTYEAAVMGNVIAETDTARAHFKGDLGFLGLDDAEVDDMLQSAADSGYGPALFQRALRVMDTVGPGKGYPEMRECLERARESGDGEAAFCCAVHDILAGDYEGGMTQLDQLGTHRSLSALLTRACLVRCAEDEGDKRGAALRKEKAKARHAKHEHKLAKRAWLEDLRTARRTIRELEQELRAERAAGKAKLEAEYASQIKKLRKKNTKLEKVNFALRDENDHLRQTVKDLSSDTLKQRNEELEQQLAVKDAEIEKLQQSEAERSEQIKAQQSRIRDLDRQKTRYEKLLRRHGISLIPKECLGKKEG